MCGSGSDRYDERMETKHREANVRRARAQSADTNKRERERLCHVEKVERKKKKKSARVCGKSVEYARGGGGFARTVEGSKCQSVVFAAVWRNVMISRFDVVLSFFFLLLKYQACNRCLCGPSVWPGGSFRGHIQKQREREELVRLFDCGFAIRGTYSMLLSPWSVK